MSPIVLDSFLDVLSDLKPSYVCHTPSVSAPTIISAKSRTSVNAKKSKGTSNSYNLCFCIHTTLCQMHI